MKLKIMEEFSGSNNQMIVKGKRTKRPRRSSSASSNGGEYYNSLVLSPTTSSSMSIITEEDEDMANCLILLACGSSPRQLEENNEGAASKFSSRKFTEIATTTKGKVGICLYECKICNRTFPSFQALGGHRESHKKAKTAPDDDQKKPPPSAPPLDNQEEKKGQFPPPPSTELLTKIWNKPKIHECSICGSEFGSGQALGGHMRRHRPAPSTSSRIGSSTDKDTTSHDDSEKPRSMFALDLNLPVLPEDEKLQQFPAKQQSHLVFSAADTGRLPLLDREMQFTFSLIL